MLLVVYNVFPSHLLLCESIVPWIEMINRMPDVGYIRALLTSGICKPLLPRFHGKTVIIPVMDTIRAALYNYWLVEAITPQQLMSHFMDLTSISVTPGTSIHTGLLIMIGTFTHIIDCTVNYCYDLLSALTGLVNNYFE